MVNTVLLAFVVVLALAASSNSNPVKNIEGLTYLGSFYSTKNLNGITGSDYHVSLIPLPWGEAERYCRDHTAGALVSIESKEENDKIHILLKEKGIDYIWTSGAYDTGSEQFRWASTGATFDETYTNWRQSNPREPSTTDPAYSVAYWNDRFNNYWLVRPNEVLTHFLCEIPTTPQPIPCYEKNDLVMVLDGSGSIGAANFVIAKDFVALLATAFQKRDDQRISLVVYSSTSVTIFNLDNSFTPDEMEVAITSTSYAGGGTYTDLGIDNAVAQLITSPALRPRKMVVFTDGASSDRESTKLAAARAQANGIKSYSVGIGQSISQEELLTIAGGNPAHVFTTQNFGSLIELIAPLSRKVCEN